MQFLIHKGRSRGSSGVTQVVVRNSGHPQGLTPLFPTMRHLAWILKVVNVNEPQFSHGRTQSPLLFKFQTIDVDFDNRSIGEGVVEYVDERHAHSATEPRGVVALSTSAAFLSDWRGT